MQIIRIVISTAISIVVLYLILSFTYENVEMSRPVLDDAKFALLYAYDFTVDRFGKLGAGLIVIFLIFGLSRVR